MEQLDYNLLFRWFVGLGMDDAVPAPRPSTRPRSSCWTGSATAPEITLGADL